MGIPMPQPMPQSQPQPNPGAFFQAPMAVQQQQTAPIRKEMRGPTNVDDILQTFKEVRAAETETHPIFSPMPSGSIQPNPPAMNSPPARQALNELQSVGSDDIQSLGSAATGRTGGGGKRRKAQLPVGNMLTLNV